MESAAELHEARVLRGRIEALEAEREKAESSVSKDVLHELDRQLGRLKTDFRQLLARQADLDYRRRRALWLADSGSRRRASIRCACA